MNGKLVHNVLIINRQDLDVDQDEPFPLLFIDTGKRAQRNQLLQQNTPL